MASGAFRGYSIKSLLLLVIVLLSSSPWLCSTFSLPMSASTGTTPTTSRLCAATEDVIDASTTQTLPPTEYPLKYEFLDAGGQMRLEKFGKLVVARSCVSAVRTTSVAATDWRKAHLTYTGASGKVGSWTGDLSNAEDWKVGFGHITLSLSPSEMGQVGVFPEQAPNWHWLARNVHGFHDKRSKTKPIHILNAFAYTGAATIACCVAPTVHVTHLDASKSFTQQAKDNFELSATQGEVRWIVDDCKSFLQREARRIQDNERPPYDGIILDPPAFGRFGSKMWKLDEDFPKVLELLPTLLSDEPLFVLLTSHDSRWPTEKLRESLQAVMNKKLAGKSVKGHFESGGMFLKPPTPHVGSGKAVPRLEMGYFARWARRFV